MILSWLEHIRLTLRSIAPRVPRGKLRDASRRMATSRWFPPFETRPAAAPQDEVSRFERILLIGEQQQSRTTADPSDPGAARSCQPGAEFDRRSGPRIAIVGTFYFAGSPSSRPSGQSGPTGMSSKVIMPAWPSGNFSNSACASAGSVTFIRKTAPDPSILANH